MSVKYPLKPGDEKKSSCMRYYYRNQEARKLLTTVKHICECGGKYSTSNKNTHMKTNKHKHYMVEKLIEQLIENENI